MGEGDKISTSLLKLGIPNLSSDSLTPLPATIPTGSIVDTYLRDSGGEGQDRSVPRQLEAIKEYCARYGLQLRHIYKDVAKSGGSTAGRDAFDHMIASTRDQSIRPVAILLWNYARFARDLDDSTYYKALLRSKRGIIIHSLTDHIPEGPYGRFVEILIDISNEEKRRQTSIDAKDGLRSIVAQGAVPGTPPRGFKREPIITLNPRTGKERKNHRWIPDPKYINRIRKAFQMRAAGKSLNEIQKVCRLFTTINSYATFWKNPLYYGTLEYGGITYENYCEPIITKELWDKVRIIQKKFYQGHNLKSGDRNHPRSQSSEFLLGGLARCARCGAPLYCHTSRQKSGYKYQAYLCTRAYRTRGSCSKGRIPKIGLEAAIINTLTTFILKRENLNEMHHLILGLDDNLASEQNDRRREILTQIAATNKQLNNIADAIAENGMSLTLQTRLNLLEQQRIELDLALNELENAKITPRPIITAEKLENRLEKIIGILQGKDEDAKKQFLRGFLSYIDAEREGDMLKSTIYYYLPLEDDDLDQGNDPSFPLDTQDNDYVPSPHNPVGALSIPFEFFIKTKKPR